jgi:predicted small integral membrane protein
MLRWKKIPRSFKSFCKQLPETPPTAANSDCVGKVTVEPSHSPDKKIKCTTPIAKSKNKILQHLTEYSGAYQSGLFFTTIISLLITIWIWIHEKRKEEREKMFSYCLTRVEKINLQKMKSLFREYIVETSPGIYKNLSATEVFRDKKGDPQPMRLIDFILDSSERYHRAKDAEERWILSIIHIPSGTW